MTKILALDTSSQDCSVALWIDGILSQKQAIGIQKHGEVVLGLINSLLDENNISLDALDVLAVSVGPGSFTGVRVGVSVISALALALDLKVIPVSSLAALAQMHVDSSSYDKSKTLLVAQDARMQEVYSGEYYFNKETGIVELLGKEKVLSFSDLVLSYDFDGKNAREIFALIGNGYKIYADTINELPKDLKVDTSPVPRADYVLKLANYYYKKGMAIDVFKLEPVYLREAVVG